MANRGSVYQDGKLIINSNSESFFDDIITSFEEAVHEEISDIPKSIKELLYGEIIDTIPIINKIKNFYDFTKNAADVINVGDSDENNTDKAIDMLNLGAKLTHDILLQKIFTMAVDNIAKNGIRSILKAAPRFWPLLAVGALVGGTYFSKKLLNEVEKNPEFYEFNNMMRQSPTISGYPLSYLNNAVFFYQLQKIAKEKKVNENQTEFEKLYESLYASPIWELAAPNYSKPDNQYLFDEYVAGFDERLMRSGDNNIWVIKPSPLSDDNIMNRNNDKNDIYYQLQKIAKEKKVNEDQTEFEKLYESLYASPIWELAAPNYSKPDNQFLFGEYAAGFDERLMCSGDNNIWVIKPSPLSDDNIMNRNNDKNDLFDEEDIKVIQKMTQKRSVINYYTLPPKIDLSKTSITQSLDNKMIMNLFDKALKEEIKTKSEGVYK